MIRKILLTRSPSIELVAVAIAKSSTARSAKQKSDRGNGGSFTRPNPSTRECRNIEVTLVRLRETQKGKENRGLRRKG